MSDDDIVNVRYMVNDVEESVDFYTTLLGFEVLTNFAPAFADVKRGNLRLLLAGPKSSAGRPMPDGDSRAREVGTGSTSSSTTSTPRSTRLRHAGAHFRNDILEGPGGRQILLQDPSGNVVELFQPAER